MTDVPATAQTPRRGRGRPNKALGLTGAPKTVPPSPKPYDGVPESVLRLDALRPGQRLRLYRGSQADLDNESTPAHSALLLQVFAHARRLEERGKISLREEPVELANLKLVE